MSATDTQTPAPFEAESKEIAAAITTLGRLLPPGMMVTVAHPLGLSAIAQVFYPDGSSVAREFQGGALH